MKGSRPTNKSFKVKSQSLSLSLSLSPSPSLSLPLHVVLQAMATRPPPSPRSPSPRRPRSESLESPSSPVQLYPERRRSVRKGGAKDGRTREGRESRRCKRRPSNDSRWALTRVSVFLGREIGRGTRHRRMLSLKWANDSCNQGTSIYLDIGTGVEGKNL